MFCLCVGTCLFIGSYGFLFHHRMFSSPYSPVLGILATGTPPRVLPFVTDLVRPRLFAGASAQETITSCSFHRSCLQRTKNTGTPAAPPASRSPGQGRGSGRGGGHCIRSGVRPATFAIHWARGHRRGQPAGHKTRPAAWLTSALASGGHRGGYRLPRAASAGRASSGRAPGMWRCVP